jgi:hypothetical protein
VSRIRPAYRSAAIASAHDSAVPQRNTSCHRTSEYLPLIDIYGAIRAYNPTSDLVIMAAQDLTQHEVANHIVLIGGLT